MCIAAHPESNLHARQVQLHVVKADTANQAAVVSKGQEGEALLLIERLGCLTAKALGGCRGRLVHGTLQEGRPSAKRVFALGDRLANSRAPLPGAALRRNRRRVLSVLGMFAGVMAGRCARAVALDTLIALRS